MPPRGIASRALIARLTSAVSSSVVSTVIGQISSSTATSSSMALPRPVSSTSRTEKMLSRRSTVWGLTLWRRANVSNCRVSAAPRCEALSIAWIARTAFGSSPENFLSMLRLPEITISKLLKSCATPPVSCPSASSFCDSASWRCIFSMFCWASRRSVMSRVILAKPICTSSSSRIGSITTLAQKKVPSLRTRQPSSS